MIFTLVPTRETSAITFERVSSFKIMEPVNLPNAMGGNSTGPVLPLVDVSLGEKPAIGTEFLGVQPERTASEMSKVEIIETNFIGPSVFMFSA